MYILLKTGIFDNVHITFSNEICLKVYTFYQNQLSNRHGITIIVHLLKLYIVVLYHRMYKEMSKEEEASMW